MTAEDLVRLIRLLPGEPGRLFERMRLRAEIEAENWLLRKNRMATASWDEVVEDLRGPLGLDVASLVDEPELRLIEWQVRTANAALTPVPALPVVDNAAIELARACYLMCRVLQPNVVVETGVSYGVTSAFILKAISRNGRGALHSIDRAAADPAVSPAVGALVPAALRHRWTLHAGSSARLLPRVLADVGPVGVFLHDSRHTYLNMRFELRLAGQHLARGGAVLVDDVERNRAFQQWVRAHHPRYWKIIRPSDKRSLFGLALLSAA